jgi:ATP-dependent DNA helicase RecG
MDMTQLQALVAQGESETLEFKKTTGERREAMHSLCAMLNHRGGRVLFGIEPNGRIQGQQVADRTLEEIVQEIQQIEPTIFPQIDRVDVRPGLQVVVVAVSSGSNRPYSYKGQAYKRVGNTSPKMSRQEYNRILLERFHGERRWETEPAEGWTVGDLDITELMRTIDEAIQSVLKLDVNALKSDLQRLRALGLIRQAGKGRGTVLFLAEG